MTHNSTAFVVPITDIFGELSEKEWLQKYRPGKYEFKEEDMKQFPDYVCTYVKTWPIFEGKYTFYIAPTRL